jgi:hypothetical protein
VSFKHVGTVEVLRARTYRIDPTNRDRIATEAIVMPGAYPLLSDGFTRIWLMTGTLNGSFLRRGDGMFIASPNDMPLDGLTVTFPSASYGPDEWAAMLNDPVALPGDEQRLRITEETL